MTKCPRSDGEQYHGRFLYRPTSRWLGAMPRWTFLRRVFQAANKRSDVLAMRQSTQCKCRNCVAKAPCCRPTRIPTGHWWSIKPELTGSSARQSVVFPPSGDSGYLSIQLERTTGVGSRLTGLLGSPIVVEYSTPASYQLRVTFTPRTFDVRICDIAATALS